MFHEVCIYEAMIDKQEEIEQRMREAAAPYKSQGGVIDVTYIKRTHRQKDFIKSCLAMKCCEDKR